MNNNNKIDNALYFHKGPFDGCISVKEKPHGNIVWDVGCGEYVIFGLEDQYFAYAETEPGTYFFSHQMDL